MINDKKHATSSSCMPDGGPCKICDEPAPAQELDLDALEAKYTALDFFPGPTVKTVLALIARVREVEQLLREKAEANLQAECDAKIAALRRAREAEQLLRDIPPVQNQTCACGCGEVNWWHGIGAKEFDQYLKRVAEFLKPKAGV